MNICDSINEVDQAKEGSVQAFGELFSRYEKDLFIYARIMVGNDEDAKDIVQDTFSKAFSSIKTLRDSEFFKTWITRILINNCKRFKIIRFNKKTIAIAEDDIWNEPLDIEEIALIEAIDKLDDKYKKVIVLRFFNDLAVKEIASLLHMPEGTIKSRLSRGIEGLKKVMEVK